MNFGFSYIGLIFLLMLMITNIIWSKNKPKDYEKYEKNENKILLAFLLLGIYGKNVFLIVSTIILGIGHIGIHLNHKKEAELQNKSEV